MKAPPGSTSTLPPPVLVEGPLNDRESASGSVAVTVPLTTPPDPGSDAL